LRYSALPVCDGPRGFQPPRCGLTFVLNAVQGARAASTKAAVASKAAATAGKFRATIFPGDGIGPEIAQAVIKIFEVNSAAPTC